MGSLGEKQGMKRGQNIGKIIAILLTLAVLGSTAGILTHAQAELRAQIGVVDEKERQAAPHIKRLEELAGQIRKLNGEVETLERVGTRMSLTVFTQCSANLYERCYPIAKMHGEAGIFVISGEQMIEREGCITLAQYDELISCGWEAAISLPQDLQAAEDYLTALREEFVGLERDFPRAVWFEEGTFVQQGVQYAKEQGFNTMLYQLTEPYAAELDTTMQSIEDPIYIPYLFLAQNKKVFPIFREYTDEGGSCALATRYVVYANEFALNSDRADPEQDSVVGVMGNVYEVVAAEFAYHRKPAEYRAELYDSYVVLAERKNEMYVQIEEIKAERKRLNALITEIFGAELLL